MKPLEQRIIFVTGKGGVGKSTVSAGLASYLAKTGRRVLLAELGNHSFIQFMVGLPSVGPIPVATGAGFDLVLWSGDSCLREYVRHLIKVESVARLFFENRVMRALIGAAPGLSEIAILGKITSGVRHSGPPLQYDTIVVDSYATGHMLGMLRVPRGLMNAIEFGPMGAISREIARVVGDPRLTAFVLVTLLEELPVSESLEFLTSLRNEFSQQAHLVANRVLQAPLSQAEWLALAHDQKAPDSLRPFADYVQSVLGRQALLRERMNASGLPLHEIPLLLKTEKISAPEVGEILRSS